MNSSAPFDSQRAIDHLRRQVRILTCVVAVMSSGLVVLTLAAFRQSSPAIIRARGIIIEDQVGRERILIGAPIPFAKNRVRTDTARVAQLWAGRFPDRAQYMGYYKKSVHRGTEALSDAQCIGL